MSCGATGVQEFFEVTNTGTTPVTLSDIGIRFWVNDTSGRTLVPHVWTGGSVTNVAGNPSWSHPVSGVSPAVSSFSPACGVDATHQANSEVTITNTDPTSLPPGATWTNLQAALNLSDYSSFTPGLSTWFSPCQISADYVSDPNAALYYQGNLVVSDRINAPSCRSPEGSQQLTGHITPEMANAPTVSAVPPSTPIRLTLQLPLRNKAQFDETVEAIYNPSSARYRQFLTPTEFASNYGGLQADSDAILAWASSNNLSVSSTSWDLLLFSVTGTAADVQRALFVNLNFGKRPDGTQFYGPDREPSLNLTTPVMYIAGLSNYFVPKPKGGGYPSPAELRARYLGPTCAAPAANYDGSGECVAIFSYSAFDINDVNTFAANELPAYFPAGTHPDVTAVPAEKYFNTTNPAYDEGTVEVTSDIEMVLSMAPRARIRVYEGDNATDIFTAMAADGCKQASTSWVYSVAYGAQLSDKMRALIAGGTTLFAATGDWGAYPTQYEDTVGAEASMITWVGGTSMSWTTDSQGNKTYSEVPWAYEGAGYLSPTQPVPDFQKFITGASGRYVPDVASQADDTVINVTYLRPASCGGKGTKETAKKVDGTSLGGPLWAGFTALMNQARAKNAAPDNTGLGFLNDKIYDIGGTWYREKQDSVYVDCFYDINSGGVDKCTAFPACGLCTLGAQQQSAVAGWDPASGWGTPRCDLIHQLASATPTTSVYGALTCATQAVADQAPVNTTFDYDTGLTSVGAQSGPAHHPTCGSCDC